MESITAARGIEMIRRLSVGLMVSVALGGTAAAAVGGILYGVSISRPKPAFFSLAVLNPTIHAGDGIRVQKVITVPPNCIPRMTRSITFPADSRSNGRPITQILTDASAPTDGDLIVPTPARMQLGCGEYLEQMSAQGCGVLSGILPPLGATSQRVAICVLPPIPLGK
jgi:hypothetical protein